ncbi:MAG TPA: metallopeptidase family protein [Nocardioidaceae bacterium]|nr:metallopeptidase family protein [Nocardioidaceae bacterium]
MVDIEPVDFEELVADALDSLPPDLAALMDNVAVFVEEESPDGRRLLGLYEGVPLTERTSSYLLVVPDRITIYRRPILALCADRDEVRHQVQVTVAHEVAHHFGIDDDRLDELGYA